MNSFASISRRSFGKAVATIRCGCGGQKSRQSGQCADCRKSQENQQSIAHQNKILRLRCSGLNPKEIAEQLKVSPKTVEFHLANIAKRAGTLDPFGIALWAVREGIVMVKG